MKLNWSAYLWMRCYSNGAQFLDRILGPKPDFDSLETLARKVPPGCGGVSVLPFILSEPSLGVHSPRLQWFPSEPSDPGVRFRACLEALAYLIALGVNEHIAAGQQLTRITVSGGIARSGLMGEILASVLNFSLVRLQSNEGPALGAAVAALSSMENHLRKQRGIAEPYSVDDAVQTMVKFRDPVLPNAAWVEPYRTELAKFRERL
jgi:sugar (pentulose or hexulose) kinase